MSRFYNIKGEQYVSSTTFLGIINKGALPFWYVKEERARLIRILDRLYKNREGKAVIRRVLYDFLQGDLAATKAVQKASAFGNAIHTGIECFLRGDVLPPLNKKQKKVFLAWKEWWAKSGFAMIGRPEMTVWDDKLKIAGTMDLRAKRKGKIYILDWKTGKGIWPEHFLQNISYRYMAALRGMKSDGGILIHIPRDGTSPYEVPVPPEAGTMKDVEAALRLWRWFEEQSRRMKRKKWDKDEIKKPT